MTLRSSRFRSPWFATAVIGVLGAIMCLTVSLNTLVNLTGASLVADYALIAIAALFARPTGATAHSPYKMPLWPLPPILALISLGYIFTKQTSLLLCVTLVTIGIGLVYLAGGDPAPARPGLDPAARSSRRDRRRRGWLTAWQHVTCPACTPPRRRVSPGAITWHTVRRHAGPVERDHRRARRARRATRP